MELVAILGAYIYLALYYLVVSSWKYLAVGAAVFLVLRFVYKRSKIGRVKS